MNNDQILAIDCGASRVCAAIFSVPKSGEIVLESFVFESIGDSLGDGTEWIDSVEDVLKRAFSGRKEKISVGLITPGHLSLTKFIKVPNVEESKIDRIVQFEARQNIPYPLEEVVWDYQIVADDGVDFDIALTAVRLDILEELCDRTGEIGCAPDCIEPSSLSQISAFHYNYPEVREGVLLVNVGARSSNLIFLQKDRFYVRNIAFAGNSITQSIASALELSFEDAEELKVSILDGSLPLEAESKEKMATDEAMQSFVSRFALEVTRTVATYRRQSGADRPQQIYVTGGGSLSSQFRGLLAEKTNLSVEHYDPLRRVQFSANVNELTAKAHAHFLGESVGIAASYWVEESKRLKLLPPRVIKDRAFRKRAPFYLMAAFLLVATVGLSIMGNRSKLTAYDEKVKNIENLMFPVDQINRQIRMNLAAIEESKDQMNAIKGLVETKSNWINFFSDLQERLVNVEDVWLEKVQVIRGSGPSTLASSFLGGLEKTKSNSDESRALRLNLTGRLLDKDHPVSRVSQDSYNRVKQLLVSFEDSQFIVSVENERFDNRQPGVLKFDFILVVNPRKPL
ncbi:MAG: pilus assembly protein PilM [Opitutaceae bacterium]|nr:pilus assembly protein PilM [Opitutaceae bacterium]